jgi:hypothetical protein
MRVSAWRQTSTHSAALLVLTFGCFLAGSGGCNQNATDDMSMPSDKLKAITAADAVISSGEREIKDGEDIKDKDADQSAKLIKQGDADKARGEAMRDHAYQMK